MESNSVFRGVGKWNVPDGDDKKEQSVRDWQHYQGRMKAAVEIGLKSGPGIQGGDH